MTVKPIIPQAAPSDPQRVTSAAASKEVVQEPLPPMPFDHDPTTEDFENLIRTCPLESYQERRDAEPTVLGQFLF